MRKGSERYPGITLCGLQVEMREQAYSQAAEKLQQDKDSKLADALQDSGVRKLFDDPRKRNYLDPEVIELLSSNSYSSWQQQHDKLEAAARKVSTHV